MQLAFSKVPSVHVRSPLVQLGSTPALRKELSSSAPEALFLDPGDASRQTLYPPRGSHCKDEARDSRHHRLQTQLKTAGLATSL